MSKHSITPPSKWVFNKTMAVALAAGVSLGGVTVAAPTAGAVAGHDRAISWEDSDRGNDPNNLTPVTWKDRPTWGSPMEGSGGVYTDVPTSDGLLTGFSGVYGGYTAGKVAGGAEDGVPPYGESTLLRDMRTAGIHSDAPERDLSMDSKKMLYVAYSFVNDIVENQGLSQEAQNVLIKNGYEGEFYDELTMSKNYWSGEYDDVLVFDKKPTIEEVRGEATSGNAMVITKADYVAFVASYLAGSVYSLDGGNQPVRVIKGDLNSDTRPLTFGDMYDRENFSYTDYDKVNTDNDRYSMAYAMINIARGVSDEEVNKADLKVYKNPDFIIPPLFSISNSDPAPVKDLPQAPIDDIYVDDIAKQDNGDYLVTRNDGEEWTIPVGELADRIEDLESKPTVSPEDLDGIKKDLDKAKDDIKDLKAGDDDLQDEIDKINDDLDKLTPRVDDLEDRVTDLENNGIKEVRDNGDGTYTIIRNDGSEVDGKIGDTQDIKEIIPNEDGTMTIIHKDGAESVVDLKQVEITEQNEGTPNHTVTITSPNGDTVTFNVFDNYVTDVVKNENGNYDIFRSDVDGGNTVWKTIVLSDLRDKIADLETRADGLDEKDADLQRQIDELKDNLGNTEKEIESLKDRTEGLEKAVAQINARLNKLDLRVSAIDARLTALEGRVDNVENTQHAWAQCFSGILGTAIPLLAAVPFVAGSQIQIPGAAQWNNQIQRTLGIYNDKLNRMAGQYSGVVKAAATILGVAGTIGLGVHTAKACGPYSKTEAMKETKAGKLSSKLENRKSSSSKKEGLSSREK